MSVLISICEFLLLVAEIGMLGYRYAQRFDVKGLLSPLVVKPGRGRDFLAW